VLTGTGTAGAYHAGVLRALQEAGVKIDVLAGVGAGAASAMFAAVDGGARLWNDDGVWRGMPGRAYRWNAPYRAAGWGLLATLALLLVPLVWFLAGTILLFISFLLSLAGIPSAAGMTSTAGTVLTSALGSAALPARLPGLLLLVVLVVIAFVGAWLFLATRRPAGQRREQGAVWTRAFGVPLSSSSFSEAVMAGLWTLVRGAVQDRRPTGTELSRRYVELLTDNLGQPGFRELVLTAHDLDSRRDLVFALLSEPHRKRFFGRAGREGSAEILDLGGLGRDHAVDALGGALSVPILTAPRLLVFAPDSFWRGETHRVCHRVSALGRLVLEAELAGAEQVVLVSATEEPGGPHALSAGRGDARGRAGEMLAAFEAAAVRDAVEAAQGHFQGIFLIRPLHNPVGPFDFGGAYDQRSDRHQSVAELIDRGYEDAYRQFIEPVVGASGERLEARDEAAIP
jgi:hypothetical protein